MDLHDAVDEMQSAAVSGGIVDAIGQDVVQQIMTEALRPAREREWTEPPPPSIEPPARPDSHSRTPEATIDALLYALRRGLPCLNDQNNVTRLRACDEEAIRRVAASLTTWPGVTPDGEVRDWLPAWSQPDIAKLLELWKAIR
jgi:hypothetical protein